MNVTTIRRENLDRKRLEAMHALMARHFSGVDQLRFVRDLQDKNRVVVVEDDDRRVRGFTTLRLYPTSVDGRQVEIVCSGDTIVDTSARWNTALARGWLDAVLRLKSSRPAWPLYWLMICSGYRTYRFLPVFLREFWPRFDRVTPAPTRRMMRRLATERWGKEYSPGEGIVRFARPQVLPPGAAWPSDGRRRNPHVEFFLRRNPGHHRGDELVCLAPIDESNLTGAGRRVLRAIADGARGDEATG